MQEYRARLDAGKDYRRRSEFEKRSSSFEAGAEKMAGAA
jgi:hypothetical protein